MGNGKSSDEAQPPDAPSDDKDEKKQQKKKGMFAMMGEGYEQLINAIIRPPRASTIREIWVRKIFKYQDLSSRGWIWC